jgi:hypothetical protein
MDLPPLLHPDRVASASIAGYLYQTVGIALLWLDLQANEVLVCEGNEDADRLLLGGEGTVSESVEIQFKLRSENISIRDPEVAATVFGFLRAFHAHTLAGRPVRFVFASSAPVASQRLHGGVSLPVDVLRTWMARSSTQQGNGDVSLIQSIRALAEASRPPWDEGSTKAQRDHDALEAAIQFLDEAPARWSEFLSRVEWQFDRGGLRDLRAELERAVSQDLRTAPLPHSLMAQRLVCMVLDTTCEPDHHLRALTMAGLDRVVTTSGEELQKWAEESRFVAAWAWLIDHEGRINALESKPWADVDRRSARTYADWARFAVLDVGNRRVRIERELLPDVVRAVERGHVVITGDAGSGKSGLLHALREELTSRGLAVLTFDADDRVIVEGTLLDVLEQHTEGTLVVLIDALDSVRGSEVKRLQKALQQLVQTNCTIVATVRTFDLIYGHGLRRIFAGLPPTPHSDPLLTDVRHVRLGDLSDDEIAQVERELPELASLARDAPNDLRDLLRNPFCLSLAGQLVAHHVAGEALRAVSRRIDLLKLFWEDRVCDDARGKEAREHSVRQVCIKMIDGGRLSCDKAAAPDSETRADLLSMNIFREPRSDQNASDDHALLFAHHILFDYAVSRVWLPKDAVKLAAVLDAQPRLLVFIRPSLEMWFADLWVREPSRRLFWEATLLLSAHESLRDLGKIVGPSVAAREASTLDDLEPLLGALKRSEPGADLSLAFLVGALERERVAGAGAGPWSAFAEALSRMDRRHTASFTNRLLQLLTGGSSSLTDEQLASSGAAARNVLRFALDEQDAQWLLTHAIRFVCATAASDRADVATVLSKVIDAERLKRDGYALAPVLCRHIDQLSGDPSLVAEIYVHVLATPDESPTPTRLGGGVVLSMSSNRRQDYQGALYSLAKAFPDFLRASPASATDALFRIAEHYERRGRRGGTPASDIDILIDGRSIAVRLDAADSGDDFRHDKEVDLLHAWENRVAEWASTPNGFATVEQLFAQTLAAQPTSAIWRRWLRLGSRMPNAVGPVVAPLLENAEIYSYPGLSFEAVECMRAVFPVLAEDRRARVERALLSLVSRLEERHALYRLGGSLGGLDPRLLVTDEARDAHARVSGSGVSTKNEPSMRIYRTEARTPDPDEWLRLRHVPIDHEPHRSILSAARALSAMRTGFDSDLTKSRQDLLAAMLSLEANVETQGDGLAAEVADLAWEELAKSALALCADDNDEFCARLVPLALKAAAHRCPKANQGEEASFRKFPSWTTPHVRGDAAELIGRLAARDPSPELLGILRELAEDDCPGVRFRTYRALALVTSAAPGAVVEIVEHALANDENPGTLAVLVEAPVRSLADANPQWSSRVVGGLLGCAPRSRRLRRTLVDLLVDLWIASNDRSAGQLLAALALCPWSEETHEVTLFLRELVRVRPGDARNDRSERARLRATRLMLHMAAEAARHLEALRSPVGRELDNGTAERLRGCARLVDECAKEIHFASGAFESKKGQACFDEEAARTFLVSMAPAIEILADAGVGPAAHDILQTLEFLLPCDPKLVIRLAAKTVLAARDSQYQLDHVAAQLVVRITSTILAEHRALLDSDDESLEAVLDVLDVFVRVGWPEAFALTYGLQDVFR